MYEVSKNKKVEEKVKRYRYLFLDNLVCVFRNTVCKLNRRFCLQSVSRSFCKILLHLGDSEAGNRGNNAAFRGVDENSWDF